MRASLKLDEEDLENIIIRSIVGPAYKEKIDKTKASQLYNYYYGIGGWSGNNIVQNIKYHYDSWGLKKEEKPLADDIVNYYNSCEKIDVQKNNLKILMLGLKRKVPFLMDCLRQENLDEEFLTSIDIAVGSYDISLEEGDANFEDLVKDTYLSDGGLLFWQLIYLLKEKFSIAKKLANENAANAIKNSVMDKTVDAAIDWWAQKFYLSSGFDKDFGDDSYMNYVGWSLNSLFPQKPKISNDQKRVFKESLKPLIIGKLIENKKCILRTDYYPMGLLYDAVLSMELPELNCCLPTKTVMEITCNSFSVNGVVVWSDSMSHTNSRKK